jgi:hypothetical protein
VRGDAVRCGAVRCDAVRCGVVWCGAMRCGAAVRCGEMRHEMQRGAGGDEKQHVKRLNVPYGSLSTSPNTGMFSVVLSLRRNKLQAGAEETIAWALVSGLPPLAPCGAHRVATSGCPLAVMTMQG